MLFFLSVLVYGTISQAPGFQGGWYLAGRMRLIWQHENGACMVREPHIMWPHCRCAEKACALNLPQGLTYRVFMIPFIFGFWRETFLNRPCISFYYFFNVIFIFYLWSVLPLLVPTLLRNHWSECKILLKNGHLCFCNPWGLLRVEMWRVRGFFFFHYFNRKIK